MEITMIIATTIAFFVKGVSGFANTLVFNAILSFSISNINISPVELLVGYPSNMIIAWNKRKETNYRIWLPLASLVFIGLVPGVLFLKFGNAQLIKILFGIVVICIAIQMLLQERHSEKKETSKIVHSLVGIIAGLMCGVFGIGVLLAAYIGRVTDNSDAFKGNLCIVFLIENTFRIILYSVTGIINVSIIINSLQLLPFMVGGLLIGMKCSNLLPEKLIKKTVILLLIISGFSLVFINILTIM